MATVERPDIPNRLSQLFGEVPTNQVWFGDTLYIWTGFRWSHLAVMVDLYARCVVGWRGYRDEVPVSVLTPGISIRRLRR